MKTFLRTAVSLIALLLMATGLVFSSLNVVTTTTGGNWSNPSTWLGDTLPHANSNVVINNGASLTVDGADSCATFTWLGGNMGGELTINSGARLGVKGVFNMNSATATANRDISITGFIYVGGAFAQRGASATQLTTVTFAASSGVLEIVGNDSEATNCGGTIMTNGGTLAIGGTFGNNGATFTPGTGTVEYFGTGVAVTALTYNNLILAGSGEKTGLASATVNGTLSLRGTTTVDAAPSGSYALVYAGSAAQTTGPELLATMNKLVTIDNTNGVTLGSSTTCAGGITCALGNLTTNSFNVDLGSAGTITESNGNELLGSLTVTHTLSSGVNDTFGGCGLEVDALGAAPGVVTLTRGTAGNYERNGNSGIFRYYQFSASNNSGLDATVVFHYFTDELNGNTAGAMDIDVTKDGSNWNLLGGTDDGTKITATGADGMLFVTAIDTSAPLAIQLATFEATALGGSVNLSWTTVSETNNYGFYVQRSLTQTGPYATISGLIQGNGTTLQQHSYAYTDTKVPQGTYYYRIQDVSTTGTSNYLKPIKFVVSGVEGVSTKNAKPLVFKLNQNYPNPFNPTTQISYEVPENAVVSLKVYNVIGQLMQTLVNNEQTSAGDHAVTFNANNFASGVYFYRLNVTGVSHSYVSLEKMELIK
jgi:hypothetical protein